MNIVAADIGGTKSSLCLAEIDTKGKQSTLFERVYPSQNFSDATHLIEQFLQDAKVLNGNELTNKAISLFVEIYGAYIGKLAMLFKPAGGMYIASGITKKILPWTKSQIFISASLQKDRMHKLIKNTPLYLITNDCLGLQGAFFNCYAKNRNTNL